MAQAAKTQQTRPASPGRKKVRSTIAPVALAVATCLLGAVLAWSVPRAAESRDLSATARGLGDRVAVAEEHARLAADRLAAAEAALDAALAGRDQARRALDLNERAQARLRRRMGVLKERIAELEAAAAAAAADAAAAASSASDSSGASLPPPPPLPPFESECGDGDFTC